MIFFVYVDWTTDENPRPYYVGKGRLQRLNYKPRNKHHRNIAALHGQDRRIELETTNECYAFAKERKLIAQYKTYVRGGEGHWGANYTLGGEGVSGIKLTEEHKRKIRESTARTKRTPESRERARQSHLGNRHSEETKKKQSDSKRNKLTSDIAKTLWQDPAYRERNLAARRRIK